MIAFVKQGARLSFQLRIYLVITHLLAPVWPLVLGRRARRGKEDRDRLNERLGHALVKRPPGLLIWFHALGIGEAGALLSVIRKLQERRPDLTILLTTNTRAGADGLARIGLPAGVIHQYAPIDTKSAVSGFMRHWRPSAFVLAELDLWPRMLLALAKKGVPMAMVNARLTDQRFAGRKRQLGLFTPLILLFRTVQVQDTLSATRMVELGAYPKQVSVAGLLKAGADPLPADAATLANLSDAIATRPVWLAAATERREHEAVLRAHAIACQTIPSLLLILAPRQLSDADGAAQAVEAIFDTPVPRRSQGDLPKSVAPVYLADSIGEMGLWYRLASVSFIGHSLAVNDDTDLPGKNPFEAGLLGSCIVHGPCVGDFSESYEALNKAGGAVQIDGPQELAKVVIRMLTNDTERQRHSEAAKQVIDRASNALPVTVTAVMGLMTPHAGPGV